MSLTAGSKLGVYEVTGRLGAGGMGEVYKATDTRLDRTVAIKILPAELASDPERRERFEREAKTISTLQHPHICTLYDVGHQHGIDFLVMEHLEGETLQARLSKGAIPLDQALRCAVEIGDALDKAHQQDIVHRDLKPGNIMLTKVGAKLLDFGLAKLRGRTEAAGGLSAEVTQEGNLTAEGSIVGTLPYAAPEQLEGGEADARSDIWAFGCVVYEMVTGKKAFEGKSQVSLMAAIMGGEPRPVSMEQPMSPPVLDLVVATCLAKDPDERWQSVRDVVRQVSWVRSGNAALSPTTVVKERRRTKDRLHVAAAGIIGGGLVAGLFVASPDEPAPSVASSFPLETTGALTTNSGPLLSLSRDGRTLVYAAEGEEGRQLFRRSFDEMSAVPVPGTEGGGVPTLSPDGLWVAFSGPGGLMRVPLEGGSPVRICNCVARRATRWGPDGRIYFSSSTVEGAGLLAVAADGGAPQPVTTLEGEETVHRGVEVLPDAVGILFTAITGSAESAQIIVQSLETGERRRLTEGRYPRYSATGHLLFVRDSSLWSAPFVLESLDFGAAPSLVLTGVRQEGAGAAQCDVAANGTLVYVPDGEGTAEDQLAWIDRNGDVLPIEVPPGSYRDVRVSPTGSRIAMVEDGAESRNVLILDVPRNALIRETFSPDLDSFPVWTPDGSQIIFASTRSGVSDLYWKTLGPNAVVEPLLQGSQAMYPNSVTPDGSLLAYAVGLPGDIWTLSLEDGSTSPLLATPTHEGQGVFSPQGGLIAYESEASGRREVYVGSYPERGRDVQVSVNGGRHPRWAADGRELFFVSADGWLMVTALTLDTTMLYERPERVLRIAGPQSEPIYDVHPNGDRFVVVRRATLTKRVGRINVVLNWSAMLGAAPTN